MLKSIIIRCFVVVLACAVFFPGSLWLVSFIPSDALCQSVKNSSDLLQSEGDWPSHLIDGEAGRYDNFSSAIAIDVATGMENGSLSKVLSAEYHSSGNPGVESLPLIFTDENKINYARYWHGYVVILRPLLVLFDVSVIRVLFFLSVTVCLFAAMCRLWLNNQKAAAVVLLVSALAVCYFTAAMSLSLAFCFALSFIGIWVVTGRVFTKKIEKRSVFMFAPIFVLLGALTCFFDFLTVPFITLGLPLAYLVFLQPASNGFLSAKDVAVLIFTCCIAWLLGYAGLWAWKWVLVALLTNIDIVSSVFGVAAGWTGTSSFNTTVSYGRMQTLNLNFGVLGPSLFVEGAFLAGFLLLLAVSLRKKDAICLGLLCIALLPELWFIFLCNHSGMHYWFTYRELMVTICSSLLGALCLMRCSPRKKEQRKKGRSCEMQNLRESESND